MALPDDGDLNLDLTLAPPMVDDQAAPPVGEEPQQGPVVADLFPEVEEVNAIINGLTSEEVQQVVGPYSDPIFHYMGSIFPDQAADILNCFPEDYFSAEQRGGLHARAMAHFASYQRIIALMKSLDPQNPWTNSPQVRTRYLRSLWNSEFHLDQLESIIRNLQEKGKSGYWFRELKRRIEAADN